MTKLLFFFISSIGSLFCAFLLLRAWIYWQKINAFNPFVRGIHQITNWLIEPLNRFIPRTPKIDTTSLLCAWLVCVLQIALIVIISLGDLSVSSYFLSHGLLQSLFILIKTALNLVFWFTLIYCLMTWINPLSPAMMLFSTLINPLLAPFRSLHFIRNIRGIDLAPLMLLLLVQLLLYLLPITIF